MEEKCRKTGKSKLILRAAKDLVRNCVDLHHYYKCEHCSTYHVSSGGNKSGFKNPRKFK